MQHELGRCALCGCTEDRPCLGGAVFTSRFQADHVQRLVPEEEILERGATCAWVTEDEDLCSAHSEEAIATALAFGAEDELPRMVSL